MRREIRVAPNIHIRSFTIRVMEDGRTVSKYRTMPMPKDEFEEACFNTQGDLEFFLRSSQSYYPVLKSKW